MRWSRPGLTVGNGKNLGVFSQGEVLCVSIVNCGNLKKLMLFGAALIEVWVTDHWR